MTTTDPTGGTTLDPRRIEELPVNGRDLSMLLADVTPGVEQVIDVNGGVRSAGMMVYSTNYVQDGAVSNNREFGGSTNVAGLASVGEVRVETSTSNAKYNSPASVIVTTKSGSNQIHGFVFETIRNNGFGVARARQDVNYDGTPYKVPKLIRNEYCGWIDGPVYLPTFGLNGRQFYDGHNRTFFSYSRFDAQGRLTAIYDPMTSQVQRVGNRSITMRLPFPGNIIPSDREGPLAKLVYGITPLATDITNPLVTNNLKVAVATNGLPNQSNNPSTVRFDHRVSDKDNLFVKFNGGNLRTDFIDTGGSTGAPTLGKEANQTFLLLPAGRAMNVSRKGHPA